MTGFGFAQSPGAEQATTFHVDSTLVLVPVTVTDRRGAVVGGLLEDAFQIKQDGVNQQIRTFCQEDAPVSVGIVLDLSGSMRSVLGAAKDVVRRLMGTFNLEDEAFLNGISTRPRNYVDFTQDVDEIVGRIAAEPAAGDTALNDALFSSLAQLRRGVHPQKALVVISDGMDNNSRHSTREVLDLAVESDVLVYTVVIRSEADRYAKAMELSEQNRGAIRLDELASKTGGLSFDANSRSGLEAAVSQLARSLRSRYIIGYAPEGGDEQGKWHNIKVTVADPGMKAYARSGYRLN